MPILIGALVAAALSALAYFVVEKITGSKPTWKGALASFVGGGLGTAVALLLAGPAALGVGSAVAVSTTRSVIAAAAGGFVGGGSEQLTTNVLTGRPLGEHVAKDAIVAGATAGVFRGA